MNVVVVHGLAEHTGRQLAEGWIADDVSDEYVENMTSQFLEQAAQYRAATSKAWDSLLFGMETVFCENNYFYAATLVGRERECNKPRLRTYLETYQAMAFGVGRSRDGTKIDKILTHL